MIHLDYRDVRPIYTQIMDGIRQSIGTGTLAPGEKLPSVRELAAELAINPNTIQRAYRQLELEGWIVSIPGKGSFVGSDQKAAEAEKRRLLEEFDQAVAGLRAFGLSEDAIIARIRKGGR